jgi:hypothetical protein
MGIEGLALLRVGALRRFDRLKDRAREIADIAVRLDEPAYRKRRDLRRLRELGPNL